MNTSNYKSNYLPIAANMKLADVIHFDYLLIPIIGRFGIELGFGNRTIKEICDEQQIQLPFFLEILNSYHNHDYFSENSFQDYSLTLIVEYLSNTHKYYLRYKIPELEEMVEKFIKSSSRDNATNNKLVASFFEKYKMELIRHLNHEDNSLFPYTKELEKALVTKTVTLALLQKIETNYIGNNDDHNQLEEKLDDLKNLIIKFLPPIKERNILEQLLIELFRLENDLHDHSRIEDKVLIPKINQLEQIIVKLGGS